MGPLITGCSAQASIPGSGGAYWRGWMVNPVLQVIREMLTATEITENPWQGVGSSFGPNPLGFTFPSSPLLHLPKYRTLPARCQWMPPVRK